jgi:hypothetical protein
MVPIALLNGTGALLVAAAFLSPSRTTISLLPALSLALGSPSLPRASRSPPALHRALAASSGGRIASAACLTADPRAHQSRHLARLVRAGGTGESRRSAVCQTHRLRNSHRVGSASSGVSIRCEYMRIILSISVKS